MESNVIGYVLLFLVLAGIAYGGYRYYQKRKAEKPAQPQK